MILVSIFYRFRQRNSGWRNMELFKNYRCGSVIGSVNKAGQLTTLWSIITDANNGIVVGEYGTILRTTNGTELD